MTPVYCRAVVTATGSPRHPPGSHPAARLLPPCDCSLAIESHRKRGGAVLRPRLTLLALCAAAVGCQPLSPAADPSFHIKAVGKDAEIIVRFQTPGDRAG